MPGGILEVLLAHLPRPGQGRLAPLLFPTAVMPVQPGGRADIVCDSLPDFLKPVLFFSPFPICVFCCSCHRIFWSGFRNIDLQGPEGPLRGCLMSPPTF